MINRLFSLSGGLGPSPGATGGRRETRPNLSLRKMIQVAGSRRMVQEQDTGKRPRRLAACEVGQRERGWGCSVLTLSSQGPCQEEGAEARWGEGGGDHDPSQPGPELRLGVGRGAANTLSHSLRLIGFLRNCSPPPHLAAKALHYSCIVNQPKSKNPGTEQEWGSDRGEGYIGFSKSPH